MTVSQPDARSPAREPGPLRRALGSVAGVVAALATAAAGWEAMAERHDRRALPPRGRFVTVEGRRVHVLVAGEEHPGPAVVLESGLGGATVASWAWVQQGIAAFAPVVAYDRAGLGWSDPGPLPRDARRLAGELHAALAAVPLAPPYVIVGHSYGGLLARMFTHLHPREVAGLVFVDSSIPAPRRPRPWTIEYWMRRGPLLLSSAPLLARVGLARAVMRALPTTQRLLPPIDHDEQRAFYSRASHLHAVADEMRAWEPLTDPEVAALDGLGDRPVYVVTAGASAAAWPGWLRAQQALARLSSDGVQETVAGAGHARLLHDPAQAARVAEAVRAVVQAVRSGRALRAIPAAAGAGPAPPPLRPAGPA